MLQGHRGADARPAGRQPALEGAQVAASHHASSRGVPSTARPPDPSASAVSASDTTATTTPRSPTLVSTPTTVGRAGPAGDDARWGMSASTGRVTVGDPTGRARPRRRTEPMGRARRARKIAATAAYGGGGIAALGAALGAAGWGVIQAEAALARRVIGAPFDDSPDDNGIYGAGPRRALSTSSCSATARPPGMGADAPARDGRRDRRQRRRGAHRAAGAADQPGRGRRRVQRPRAPARQRARGRAAPRRRAHHGRRQRRDPPHRALRVGAPARADRAAHPGAGLRGRRRHLPRPRHDPADPPAAALAHEALVARPRGRPDRRRRRGRRSHRVARRPHRAGVRRVTARDVQQGPLPPLGGRLRARGRRAAARACARPWACGAPTPPTGRPSRGAARASARSPWRPARPSRSPGTEVAPTADRRPVARAARPVGRAAAAPPRRRAAGRGHPGRSRAARRRPPTRDDAEPAAPA